MNLPTAMLIWLSQMVNRFTEEYLDMVIQVNLTVMLVLATLWVLFVPSQQNFWNRLKWVEHVKMFQLSWNQPVATSHLLHQADWDLDDLHHDLSLCWDHACLPQRYAQVQSYSGERYKFLFPGYFILSNLASLNAWACLIVGMCWSFSSY